MPPNILIKTTAFVFLFCLQLQWAVGQRCPVYWASYGQSCYRYMYQDAKSWYEARNWCRLQGGDLVKIETTQERTWILRQLGNLQSHQHAHPLWWIGLNDLDAASTWQWSDHSVIDQRVFLWMPGNPNNQGAREHCVRFDNLKMNDRPCNERINYICERSKGIPLTCDADRGWQSYPPYCYHVHGDQQTWANARKQCNREGGDLVAIQSTADETTMQGIARSTRRPYWFGLHSFQQTASGAVQWMWANGSLLTTTPYWANGAASPPGNRKNTTCSYISNSITNSKPWMSTSCNSRKYYACRKPEGVCQQGWVAHQTKCYQINIQFKYSWSQAKSYCDRQRSRLVEIYRTTDTQFLNSYLSRLRQAGVDSFWIGASDLNTTTYKWSHSGRISYQNWQHNPPTNTRNRLDCSYVVTSDRRGKWRTTSNCGVMKKAFMCSIGMNQAVHHVNTPRPQYTCDRNWLVYGTNCYQFNDHRRDWIGSGQDCQRQGAQLAKISDVHVQGFIVAHTHNQEYWIGLNDRNTERHFMWVSDNSPARFVKWNPHEPNNQGDENCVETKENGWNDKACNTGLKYICQKPARNSGLPSGAPSTTALPYSIKCGLLWEEDPNSNYCYQFQDQQLDWNDARTTCRHQGGDLLSIASREEQFYITGRIRTMVSIAMWIGANDRGSEGGWSWTDRSPFAYLNWQSGEPNDYHHNEDCGAIFTQKGTWNDSPCTQRNGYICKKLGRVHTTVPPSTTVHVPAGMVLGCPNYWKPHGTSCYQLINRKLNWNQGRSLCRQHGGYLASVASQADQNFLVSQLPANRTGGYWIGLNDQLIQNNFQWSDGSKVTFTAWAPREPNNFAGHREDCVLLYLNGGKWNDGTCNDPQNGVICKRPKQAVSSTQSPQTVGCTLPAVGYQASCYFYVAGALKTWSNAIKDCAARFNGTLAIVNDRYTQAFVANYLNYKGDMFWIGMSDAVTPGTYLWKDGTKVDFTFWGSAHTGRERNTCVALTTSLPIGLWENKNCTETHHYVCEYPRKGFTTPPPTTTLRPVQCPVGWSGQFTNSLMCYKVFYNDNVLGKMTWTESRDYCRGLGGDLASIHREAQNVYIGTLLRLKTGSFWIGLNDRDTEAGYVWTDGRGTDYSNWNPNEPNDYNGNEDCTQIFAGSLGWNDNNCFITSNWICEIRRGQTPVTTLPPPTGITSSLCGTDPGWSLFNGSCYLPSPSSGDSAIVDWYDAGQYCISQGAKLTSIHSLDENNYILSLITKASLANAWVGYNELGSTTYTWTDGSLVDFDFWRHGEPNNAFGAEMCVSLSASGGTWNDDNCGQEKGFICKRKLGMTGPPTVPTVPVVNGGCRNGFTPMPNSNKCFKLDGKTSQVNWQTAYQGCMKYGQGYDIASINTAQEQAFVNTLLKGLTTNVWIGLNNNRHSHKFIWHDNSHVSYTNWAVNEPNGHSESHNGGTTEDCVEIYTSIVKVGKWNDKRCSNTRPYLCQGSRVLHVPIPSTQGTCLNGYTSYGTSCYKVVTSPASWSSANMACGNDGGSLVNVNDIYEDSYVYSIVGNAPYWIGLSDTSQASDTYKWALNWPVYYTNWGSGEPTRGSGEGCVSVMGGMWNDTSCTASMSYVCEINSATPPPVTLPPAGHCSDSTYNRHGDFCYYIEAFHTTSWPGSRYNCQRRGMQLASIHSAEEQQHLISLANSMKPLPNDTAAVSAGLQNMWIGMNKGLSDGFTWTDGTAVSFVAWADGEPSDAKGSHNEECVEMYQSGGKWNDNNCFNNKGYICKTPAIVPTIAATAAPVPPVSNNPPVNTPFNPQNTPKPVQPYSPITQRPVQPYSPTNPGRTQYPTMPPFLTYKPHSGHSQQQRATKTGNQSNGISGGAVAGIIIGVLVVLGIAAGSAIFIKSRNGGYQGRSDQAIGFDNALYSKSQQSVNIDPTRTNGLSVSSGLPGEEEDA
ncbi:macrophage mannose receptor 1-like isoform X2 [Mizuhopecten yessoensis]|uniref:macrophage mannose receptor 1-like isoform X2 n=1 Tax=Mizuhopecten yessoensis TaxID=6573 RepID=UPI000B45AF23|nr:macrophage mannose receptor 1-like isoform X2 [Mizuhopecten yessoensis]